MCLDLNLEAEECTEIHPTVTYLLRVQRCTAVCSWSLHSPSLPSPWLATPPHPCGFPFCFKTGTFFLLALRCHSLVFRRFRRTFISQCLRCRFTPAIYYSLLSLHSLPIFYARRPCWGGSGCTMHATNFWGGGKSLKNLK